MIVELLHNPADHGVHAHCATICPLPRGEQLAVWYTYPEQETHGARLALARYSSNGRWSRSWGIFADSQYSYGNPVMYEEQDGVLSLLFVVLRDCYWDDAALHYSCSSDNGITWNKPVDLNLPRGVMVRHAPVRHDGMLLLPAYDERHGESVLLLGMGSTWREHYRFRGAPMIQPALVMDSQGGAMTVFFRPTTDPRVLWRSRSIDGGRKWSSPMRTPLPCPLSGFSAFGSHGMIFVVYNHTEKHERSPISIAYSDDMGVTWSPPKHIDDTAKELSYPSFTVLPDEIVSGVYTFNRRMIKHVTFPIKELL